MLQKITCKKCGHDWLPRVDEPRKCPKCQSYSYNKMKESEQVKEEYIKEESKVKRRVSFG